MSKTLDFEVKRDDLRSTRLVQGVLPELEPGQVLFRVDRFAYTANNVTYAVVGDSMAYWSFFPAEAGWGRIPAMGFADVVQSRHPDVAEGERCFGWYPMSTHLVVQADDVTDEALLDAAPCRAATAPTYRRYTKTTGDFLYEPAREDLLALLRGLFMTSFLIDDSLADAGFAPECVWITSASSKTSIALAYLLAERTGVRSVGLTSPRNREFVASLGCYDQVASYDEIPGLPGDAPCVSVDMAGDGEVLSAIHHRLGDSLKHSCRVGLTHWEQGELPGELPGPTPEFFFAPTQLQKRSGEWGREGMEQRVGKAWRGFARFAEGWLQVKSEHGPKAVERVHLATVEGTARPQIGHVLSLHED